MSYTTRKLGTLDVLQDDRIILVNAGDPAPDPAAGFSIIHLGTQMDKDVYLEYKVYTSDSITV